MKIGVCGKWEQAPLAKGMGFDYLEMSVTSLAELTEEAFQERLGEKERLGFETSRYNVLFPGTMALLVDDFSMEAMKNYLDKAFRRVHLMGGEICVFGSGKSRTRPEAVPYDEAFRRLIAVTRGIGEMAEKHGLTIAIEPLNRGECNMITSVAEGACLRAAVNHPRVSLLSDYYHVALEGEPEADIVRVSGVIHTHIAAREGRLYPTEMEEGFRRFFRALKDSDYRGSLSVEGRTENFEEDGPRALKLLRALAGEAGL